MHELAESVRQFDALPGPSQRIEMALGGCIRNFCSKILVADGAAWKKFQSRSEVVERLFLVKDRNGDRGGSAGVHVSVRVSFSALEANHVVRSLWVRLYHALLILCVNTSST